MIVSRFPNKVVRGVDTLADRLPVGNRRGQHMPWFDYFLPRFGIAKKNVETITQCYGARFRGHPPHGVFVPRRNKP